MNHESSRPAFEAAFKSPTEWRRDMGGEYISDADYWRWAGYTRALDHAAAQRHPILGPECPVCRTIQLNLPDEAVKEIEALFPREAAQQPEPAPEQYKCTHPDHVDGVSCLDRSVACNKRCGCCLEMPEQAGSADSWIAKRLLKIVNRDNEEGTFVHECDAFELAKRCDELRTKLAEAQRREKALREMLERIDILAYDIRDRSRESSTVTKANQIKQFTSKARAALDATRQEETK